LRQKEREECGEGKKVGKKAKVAPAKEREPQVQLQPSNVMDLLIVACNPDGVPRLELDKEAEEIRDVMPQSSYHTAKSPEMVKNLLRKVKTKRFLFCGHGELQLDQP